MEWRREELIAPSVIQNPTPSVLIQNQASSLVSHTIAKIIHLIFFCSSLLQWSVTVAWLFYLQQTKSYVGKNWIKSGIGNTMKCI